jgi:hypothetical protein
MQIDEKTAYNDDSDLNAPVKKEMRRRSKL